MWDEVTLLSRMYRPGRKDLFVFKDRRKPQNLISIVQKWAAQKKRSKAKNKVT